MSSSGWQIRVGDDLSRHYTIEQLRRKRSNGVIADDVLCTIDRGQTFVSLESVLFDEAIPQAASSKPAEKPRKRNRISRLQPIASKASRLATVAPVTSPDLPSDASPGPQPASTLSAIFDAPKRPQKTITAAPMLDGLIADAVNAAAAGEFETPSEEELEVETYRIPSPPPAPPQRHATSSSDLDHASTDASPVAQAAAAALANQADEEQERTNSPVVRPGQRPSQHRHSHDAEVSDDVIPIFGDVTESKPSSLKRVLAIVTIALGLGAVGVMVWWQQDNGAPPSFEDFTGTQLRFESDSPATLEELHARTQILGVRVGQIQRALAVNGTDSKPDEVVIPELPELPRMPFVPFRQRQLTGAEQRQVDDVLSKYSALVRNGGPDGREHDVATVSTYSQYLHQLVGFVNARGESRGDVLHELSELTKLIYLLQLRQIKSDDPADRHSASARILDAANLGLAKVYSEIATGDMRFADVFERESDEERARLLLIRYWHHRAVDRPMADQWLTSALELVGREHHSYVTSSIAEVDQIEN